MQGVILFYVVFATILFSLSCKEAVTTPSEQQKPVLTASENPVAIAMNYSRQITVTGGNGSYKVKSMTDSSIIQATFYPGNTGASQFSQYVNFLGKKLGITKIIIQDSAKTAEVEIVITVATMVSSSSAIKVRVQSSYYSSIQGGQSPYAIDQTANSVVAKVTLNGSSFVTEGISAGSTSVVVRDNSNPPNKVTIPITVVPKPELTTPGTISFTSNKGNFSVTGIAQGLFEDAPTNDAGAGGIIFFSQNYSSNISFIIGYKKKSFSKYDLCSIVFTKSNLSSGTLPIDSATYLFGGSDTAYIRFMFDGEINSINPDVYQLHSGSVIFSSLSTSQAIGTFNGAGNLLRNNVPVIGNDVTLTNGSFDVPLLNEELFGVAPTVEQQKVMKFVEKMFAKELQQLKMIKRK